MIAKHHRTVREDEQEVVNEPDLVPLRKNNRQAELRILIGFLARAFVIEW